ncbi:hypothetical protein PGB90_001230 [Kerria lacca]
MTSLRQSALFKLKTITLITCQIHTECLFLSCRIMKNTLRNESNPSTASV